MTVPGLGSQGVKQCDAFSNMWEAIKFNSYFFQFCKSETRRGRDVFREQRVLVFQQTLNTLHAPRTPSSTISKVPERRSVASVFDRIIFTISLLLPFCKVVNPFKFIQENLPSIFDAVCTRLGHRKIWASSARILRLAGLVLSWAKDCECLGGCLNSAAWGSTKTDVTRKTFKTNL